MSGTEPISPYRRYLAGCEASRLSFQRDATGAAIFPPRMPDATDHGPLAWTDSAGAGTIYSATVVCPREAEPYALVLVDLDEGFRMMSRVVDVAAESVEIGDRVSADFRKLEDDGPVLPVFVKTGSDA